MVGTNNLLKNRIVNTGDDVDDPDFADTPNPPRSSLIASAALEVKDQDSIGLCCKVFYSDYPNTYTFFVQWGRSVSDSNVFLKMVTYRPTLSKFRGGPVKKTPCMLYVHVFGAKMTTFMCFFHLFIWGSSVCLGS